MNELALFAGAGGGILGGKLLGWDTVCAVEIEEYPRKVLLQRQKDGILGKFPIWDDITTFNGRPWKGAIDIVSGGFPCQDISAAGKGAGIDGERSGLWGEMSRVVCEVQPRFVFVENSPMLTSRGLHRVLGDLAEMGYNARWCVLGADDAGAPHRRKRIWILGYSIKEGLERLAWNERRGDEPGRIEEGPTRSTSKANLSWWNEDPADLPDTDCHGSCGEKWNEAKQGVNGKKNRISERDSYGPIKSKLGRMADGVDSGVDLSRSDVFGKIPRVEIEIRDRVNRVKAIGNGQVPITAAIAFTILSEGLI